MTVLPRVLAAVGALALGLGGALVVAAPAHAAGSFTVTKAIDDGTLGTLSYALLNLDPVGGNTIDITIPGPIAAPVAGFPTIFYDTVITGPAGGTTLSFNTSSTLAVSSGASLTIEGVDIVSDTLNQGQGVQSLDASLSLTDVTVRNFNTNVFFSDTVGGATFDATDVEVGGTLATPSQYGLLAEGLDGALTLTRVAASFTSVNGLGVGADGGTIDATTISAVDGAGILIGGSSTTANINHVTTARTVDGVTFTFLDSDLTVTDVQVTDTSDVGLIVAALNGTTATLTTLRVSTSDASGIVLTATDSSITASDVESHHNGLVPGCGCGGSGSGLEVYADNGAVDVSDADAHDNDAANGGGVYLGAITGAASVTLTAVTATDNTASSDGGGIYLLSADSASTIEITRATVTSNTANNNGGGIALGDIEDAGTAVTVTGSTITGNTSNVIAGPPAVSGGGGIDVEGVRSGAAVTVSSSTISGNTADDDGGGLQVVDVQDDGSSFTLSDSSVTGNTSGDFGAGLYLLNIGNGTTSTAHVTVVRTTVDGNNAGGSGGGIAINGFAPETSGLPTVLIDSSTLSNNTSPYLGGGIHVRNPSGPTAPVVKLVNSTITGNDAQAGGGFDASGTPMTIVISHSTIADNSAHTSGGVAGSPGTLEIDNSILSGATSNNGNTPNDLDVGGAFIARFSLVEKPDAGVIVSPADGNITGVSPALGALANNGGVTRTMLVAPGSPAYNAGDPAFTGSGLFDQRGQARVFERLDMGAVEWHPALAVTGTELTPGPPLIAFLLLFAGLAMLAFSRLQAVRAVA